MFTDTERSIILEEDLDKGVGKDCLLTPFQREFLTSS